MSFEAFAATARRAVEDEASAHADDLWWVLEPRLFVQRRDRDVWVVELSTTDDEALLRTVARAPLSGLAAALEAQRCALAVHVDLAVDEGIVPAVVVAVAGRLATAVQRAEVERTEAGLPRLGPWLPAQELAGDLAGPLARALRRP